MLARPEAVPPRRFALALGANLGTPDELTAILTAAIARLGELLGPLRVASFHRTRAVAPSPQPDYLNTAVAGTTALAPEALLAIGQALELAAGRRRGARWGPRPLDVDLLVVGDLVSSRPELTLPHPRMAERRFVLAPLAEIAPDLPVPGTGRSVAELLAALPEDAG